MRPLSFDPTSDPEAVLTELAAYARGSVADKYMEGELFDRLQGKVAGLLGKEAALYLPSGKLAQMAALKVLTGRTGCSRVALHPRSHIEEHEARAYQELWGLSATQLGGYDRLPTAADVRGLAEPVGAVALELPLRRLGCLLPDWHELEAICAAVRERGAYLHLDGARLWESQPFLDRPLDEIAGLVDTVYVAFDKGLGGLGGAALAGPRSVVDEVRIWQRRAGGRALRSFPYLLCALRGLDERLPRMRTYHDRSRDLASAIGAIDGVHVSPDPPHANAFFVSLHGDRRAAAAARDRVASELDVYLFDELLDAVDRGTVRFEVTVREAAFALEIDEVATAVERFAMSCADPS